MNDETAVIFAEENTTPENGGDGGATESDTMPIIVGSVLSVIVVSVLVWYSVTRFRNSRQPQDKWTDTAIRTLE